MDLMTLIGTAVGLGVVVFVVVNGDIARFLLNAEAVILIFGGTFGSVLISYPYSALKHVPGALKMMLFPPKRPPPLLLVSTFVRLSEKARREGTESLEGMLSSLPHPFLQDCVQMLLDGLDKETIEDRCLRDIIATQHRHQQVSGIFRSAGVYSPIFGLLGTLIGVVQVLRHIDTPSELAASMAVAMTASFYGIFAANFFFLPIANKLSFYSSEEVINRELIAKGILSLQQGEAPWLLSKKLEAYLTFQHRQGGAKGYRVEA